MSLKISDWEFKLWECAAMAKLIAYIQNGRVTKFKQERFPFMLYVTEQR